MYPNSNRAACSEFFVIFFDGAQIAKFCHVSKRPSDHKCRESPLPHFRHRLPQMAFHINLLVREFFAKASHVCRGLRPNNQTLCHIQEGLARTLMCSCMVLITRTPRLMRVLVLSHSVSDSITRKECGWNFIYLLFGFWTDTEEKSHTHIRVYNQPCENRECKVTNIPRGAVARRERKFSSMVGCNFNGVPSLRPEIYRGL